MRAKAKKSTVRAILAAIFLILLAASAHAENWVRVISTPDDEEGRTFVDIDTDSIRKGDDGLVYYRAAEDLGVSPTAVDCQKRLYYVIGDGRRDWKSDPATIEPGTEPATEADFVCSRV